jgi:acetyl-CoA decarbonylase/synthase complex subunit delta
MAALTQGDERLQFPVICNIGREVWKVKEVKTTQAEDPKLGDEARRGILMEAVTATTLLMAGADVLVLRHPESVKLIRKSIQDLMA